MDPAASPWHLLGAELRYWRDEVRKLNLREAAAKALCDHGDLSKWERGLARMQTDVIDRLDDLYGANGRLAALHAAMTELDNYRMGRVAPDASSRDEDDDMERRAVMQILAALGAGAAIPPGTWDALFSGVERTIAGRSGIGVDDWSEIVWEHDFAYYTNPPGTVFQTIASDFAEVSTLLKRTSTATARSGLLRISAQLAVLMGMEMSDVGDQGSSLRAWRLARRAADATGDRDLRVWVRGWEAEYGYWAGRPAPVIARLANDAIEIADGSPSRSLAEAHMVRAFLLASQGDAASTQTALVDLRRTFDAFPDAVDSDQTSPLWSFRAWAQAWALAYPYALLGQTREAIDATDQARALCPPTFHGNAANLALVYALTQARGRDVDHGLQEAIATAQAWPVSTIRRLIIGQMLDDLPQKSLESEAAHELRSLTKGSVSDA
ncbi:helix-turn-helix domain-containing protein [Nonomuraea insulae]|uniref:Helix-turn-helix domain-containing protein n=1 Tax=Nonomuraea insulae TaxID=1616787 RepID=A0ABW1CXV0_9ACTN